MHAYILQISVDTYIVEIETLHGDWVFHASNDHQTIILLFVLARHIRYWEIMGIGFSLCLFRDNDLDNFFCRLYVFILFISILFLFCFLIVY